MGSTMAYSLGANHFTITIKQWLHIVIKTSHTTFRVACLSRGFAHVKWKGKESVHFARFVHLHIVLLLSLSCFCLSRTVLAVQPHILVDFNITNP